MARSDTYILLPILNGERYLSILLESLLAQTDSDWKLLIRDDGSSDGTPQLLESYGARDARIKVLPGRDHKGVAASFDLLLRSALNDGAKQIFFCDGDDIWHPHKVESLKSQMGGLSREFGSHHPILIYTELRVVDAVGELVADSLIDYAGWSRTEPDRAHGVLLGGNFVTGCSVMLNRAAAELVTPIPPAAGLHDHWSALVVAWAGVLHFHPQALLDYRLHGGNTVGVRSRMRGFIDFVKAMPASFHQRVQSTENRFRTAAVLRERLQRLPQLPPEMALLDKFLEIPVQPPMGRLLSFLRLRLPWHSFLGWLSFLVTLPRIDRTCVPGLSRDRL